MSKERYYELYRQFLDQTISENDFRDLMEWVSDPQNDIALKTYMEELWAQDTWDAKDSPRDWKVVRNQLLRGSSAMTHADSKISVVRNQRKHLIWIYAATGVVAILVGLMFFIWQQEKFQIYSTAFGETREIKLDDGSVVTLNANSTLFWDLKWHRSGERYVKLEGEAYFDVVQTNTKDLFTVETDDLTIRVLGTTFNVSARRDQTGGTLETGKIELDLKKSDAPVVSMQPGDYVRYSSAVHSLEKATVQSITESASWLDGVLMFENVTVEEMFEAIEDQYGKKLVTTDTALLSRRMFTGIPYEDWAVAKEALELALGVEIEEKSNELFMK